MNISRLLSIFLTRHLMSHGKRDLHVGWPWPRPKNNLKTTDIALQSIEERHEKMRI